MTTLRCQQDDSATNIETVVIKRSPTQHCHQDHCSLFENILESDEVFSGRFEVFGGFWNGC